MRDSSSFVCFFFFFFQAEDGIRDGHVTGVQTCALPISPVAVTFVSCIAPPELPIFTVSVPLCSIVPRVTSDQSPTIVLSLLMVSRNTLVKFRPRCHCKSADRSLSKLIPAHQSVLPDCCT